MTDEKPRGRVILKMSVQLPDGQKGIIHVFPGSDPKELAEQFCEKHNLKDPKLRRVVERHITENMRALPSAAAKSSATSPSNGTNGPTAAPATAKAIDDTSVPYAATDRGGVPLPSPPRRDLSSAMSSLGNQHAPSSAGAPSVPSEGGTGGDSTRLEAALVRAREQTVRWRARETDLQLLRHCWRAMVGEMWQARMRQFHSAAHAEATAARAAEISELHAANARIAKLAFAQAGKTEEEALAEVRELLEPQDGPVQRVREQLERVLERDLRRSVLHKKEALKRQAFSALLNGLPAAARAAATPATAAPAPAAGAENSSADFTRWAVSTATPPRAAAGPAEQRGAEEANGGANGALNGGSSAALAASEGKVAQLTKLVTELTSEVEELTADLISTKLSLAELSNTNMTIGKEKRTLQKQLIVDSVEVHEVDYMTAPPPSSRAMGLKTRASFPVRKLSRESR